MVLFRFFCVIGADNSNMKEIQDNELNFVARHFRPGIFRWKQAWRHFRAASGRPAVFFRPVWGYALVTAFAAVALGVFLFTQQGPRQTVVPVVQTVQTIQLPDGTAATLAPGATLSFRRRGFGSRDRSVRMAGKVYFAVERNETLPFEITAADGFVRVLGTRFQVASDSTGTAVDVVDGRVLFAAAGQTDLRETDGIVLTRGMHAELAPGAARPVLADADTANPAAWATHSFLYDNTPLEEVLKELSAHFGCTFTTDARGRRLTGQFDGSDPAVIIALIEEALDIHIDIRPL